MVRMTEQASTDDSRTACEMAGLDDGRKYVLRLYVAGNTPQSARAIVNIRKICEEHLEGRYVLEVVDLSQNPEQASAKQVIAAPTLVKQLPLPLRRFIGDMSQSKRLIVGLDLETR